MNRRGFLSALVLAPVAPAIVRADSLMKIIPKRTGIIVGELGRYDGIEVIEIYEKDFYIDQSRGGEGRAASHTDLWGRSIVARQVVVRAHAEKNEYLARVYEGMLNDALNGDAIRSRVIEENRRILSKGSSPRHPGSWMPIEGDHHGEEKGRREEVLGIRPSRPDGPQDRPAGPFPHRR